MAATEPMRLTTGARVDSAMPEWRPATTANDEAGRAGADDKESEMEHPISEYQLSTAKLNFGITFAAGLSLALVVTAWVL